MQLENPDAQCWYKFFFLKFEPCKSIQPLSKQPFGTVISFNH